MLALLNFTHFVSSSGYLAIFVLSVMQSCCVPTSSELTLGFAGVLAAEGKLSLPGAIAAGVTGELLGAYLAWVIGYYGGRAFVERYGRYVLMSTADLDRAEGWYSRHERFGVFGSRLLPVIRNFVAVPAGVAEVPLVRFGVLTLLGSLVWDTAMALIGYEIGGSWKSVMKGFSDAGYLLGLLVVAAVAVVVWHRWRSYHRDVAHEQTPLGRHSGGRHSGLGEAGGGSGLPQPGLPSTGPGHSAPAPDAGRGSSTSARSARYPAGPGRYPVSRPAPTEAPGAALGAPRTPRSLSDKAAAARARRDETSGGTGGTPGDS